MKSKPMGALFGVLALVAILAIAPSAFADESEQYVTISKGDSSSQGCVDAKNCFDPMILTVAPGTKVEWKNADTASHTVSSGKSSDNETTWGSVFYSGDLPLKAGQTYSFTFNDPGTYDYFCTLHPWMTGQVIVAAAMPSPPPSPSMSMTMLQAMSSDQSETVTIDTTPAAPTNGQPLMISLNFTDASGNIHHQNYAITVTQDGNDILSNVTGHTHTGLDTQTTHALTSSDPVDIKVTLNGVGLPNTDPSTWTGPKGDMISFHVVPEFGSLASIVLAIAVISIVVFTAKTRVLPRL
ncbi:MAG: PEFG-CTERM sorting domain-containing protein [Thaumarchaeota archaeon]|nr:MAG: PEFG-CTERM sorting domain-containing protein [Nitrososphaerota archaeon]